MILQVFHEVWDNRINILNVLEAKYTEELFHKIEVIYVVEETLLKVQ